MWGFTLLHVHNSIQSVFPTKFWFISPSGFRGEDFLEINQSETRMACGFLPSFSSFGWGVSEEKIKMWKVNRRQTPDAK